MALKILLADDNITAQKMGSKILSDAGHTVIAVSNGAAAVKKIAAEKPELIIVDVYMPGYNGLEVCEKVKGAAETAKVPVLLTVTNMEPYSAEDGNRVKADGVLIKPFEATDLVAVVQKLEEKLHPAAAAQTDEEYVKTIKMSAVKEFEDESYAEWKAAETPPEEESAKPPEMSHEVASAPALGIEDLAPGYASPAEAEPAPPAEFTMPVEAAPAPYAMEAQPESAPAFDLNPSAAPAYDLNAPAPAFDLGRAEPPAEVAIAPPAELEFTSAPQAPPMEVAPAPELEVTAQAAAADVPIAQDAALVTDRSDMAQFATKFGEEHPEDVPVGIAMTETQEEAIAAIPDFLAQPMPPAETSVPVVAFETSGGAAAAVAPALEPAVKTQKIEALHDADDVLETHPVEVPAAAAPDPAAEPAPAEVISLEPAPVASAEPEHETYQKNVEQHLVAQFAAELEAAQAERPPEPEPAASPEMEPPAEAATSVAAPDDQHIAEAVSRVLERYKGELIAAIVRELKG